MGRSSSPSPRSNRSSSPNSEVSPAARDSPIRHRSPSRRLYKYPVELDDRIQACPYCPDEAGSAKVGNRDGTTRTSQALELTFDGRPESRRCSEGSLDLLQSSSSGRRGSTRPPLFDDVDVVEALEIDQLSLSSLSSSDDDDDEVEEASLFSFSSPPTSAYSLGRSPSTRKSSLSTTATSDPLISPNSVPSLPVLSFGSPSHQRGHWLPATPDKVPAPSASSQRAPLLPDTPLSTSPEKAPSLSSTSLRRASSLSSASKPSLLSKSLRSLASLPNLALLPNLLPQLPRPDLYLPSPELYSPSLKSGWGARERRRVLDSEPSWDADEARGLLSRRTKVHASGSRDRSDALLSGSATGTLPDVDLALSDFSTPVPLSPSPPPSPELATPPVIAVVEAAAVSPPPPPQRFISNTRHLLMLSIEFSMMRADKISSPLRPRAVIVRNGSPTRDGVAGIGPTVKQAYRNFESGGGLSGLNEKPRSSVSALIDILCLDKYEEDSYEGITEIVESINIQDTGPTEASRAIRKKLKYSDVHGQLRALTILKALVENCGPRFQSTFANERLVDRIKVSAGDPHTDERVKKKIASVLASWHRQFKDDPRMQLVAGLYKSCGLGAARAAQQQRSAATEAYEREQARYEQEAAARAERKAAEQRARQAEKDRIAKEKADKAKRKAQGTRTRRPPFNFEQEKPKILAAVGQCTASAQALINALQHVNREKESVTTNARVKECLEKAKVDRKAIIRYIQLVEADESGEVIGSLIAANEQIVNAVQLYDRMSKPVELDSDDEAIEEAKRLATQQGLNVPRAPNERSAEDDDAQSIRSRLSAFDMQDREVDKMQMQQRRRLDRHLSYRSTQQARTSAGGVHPDLQDLAFGSTGSSSLPPPIQPRSAEDTYRHGSLSDYSDYSSDEDSSEDAHYYNQQSSRPSQSTSSRTPPTSASSSSGQALPGTNARTYAAYVQEDERRGGQKLLNQDEDEEEGGEDDSFDPFADPEDGTFEVMTPGISTNKRMEWKEI
ncbi:Lsb5p [Sporobolomyces koalae]|uniref:Lsb5p n=1 Tax=Sporobolomyces koalae TaxID=500713 RepID=UPI00316B88A6